LPAPPRTTEVSRETKQEQNLRTQRRFHPIEFIFTFPNSGVPQGVGMIMTPNDSTPIDPLPEFRRSRFAQKAELLSYFWAKKPE
jgi:hypothetical protein